jgi:hypothetical protein
VGKLESWVTPECVEFTALASRVLVGVDGLIAALHRLSSSVANHGTEVYLHMGALERLLEQFREFTYSTTIPKGGMLWASEHNQLHEKVVGLLSNTGRPTFRRNLIKDAVALLESYRRVLNRVVPDPTVTADWAPPKLAVQLAASCDVILQFRTGLIRIGEEAPQDWSVCSKTALMTAGRALKALRQVKSRAASAKSPNRIWVMRETELNGVLSTQIEWLRREIALVVSEWSTKRDIRELGAKWPSFYSSLLENLDQYSALLSTEATD